MNERDEYLLKEGYIAGWKNAHHCLEDGRGIDSLESEAERWVNEVIADNGCTVGEYISHEAPKPKQRNREEEIEAFERMMSDNYKNMEKIEKQGINYMHSRTNSALWIWLERAKLDSNYLLLSE